MKFLRTLILIGLAPLLFFVADNHFLIRAIVISGSMAQTIPINSHVFGLRSSFRGFAHGDIIVFTSPIPDEFSEMFIKRIIALGGEEIGIRGGVVLVNGVVVYEDYAKGTMTDFEPVIVPYGYLFVMGDARQNSRDSREWGAIPVSSVIGRIYLGLTPSLTILP